MKSWVEQLFERIGPYPEPDPIKLWIATYTTMQQDRRIGEAFTTRAAVEAENERLLKDPNIVEAYFVIRELKT